MSYVEPERRTPVIGKYDVIVAGGGPAGTGAALAAARNGANTLVIERYGFLGGMYTAGYVLGVHVDKTTPLKEYEEDRPLLGGIVQELVEKLVDMKGMIPPLLWAKHEKGHMPTDPEIMKIALNEMMEDAGAKQLLHSYIVDAVVEDNDIKGVIIESKSGRQAVLADVIIDCTGDADVSNYAGAPWKKAPKASQVKNTLKAMLPMSFFTILGGVNVEKAKANGIYRGSPKIKEIIKKAQDGGFKGEITPSPQDQKKGPTRPPNLVMLTDFWGIRKLEVAGVDASKYWQRKGEAMGWAGLSYYGDCTDVRDLTEGELFVRRQVLPAVEFLRKHVPGYENCYVEVTAPQIGTRESRRIKGSYVLSFDKDIKNSLKHDDVIVQARAMFQPAFDIPYRCLVPNTIDGLLVAGRCISIDHAAAHMMAIRDEQQAMALGEASGTAAALAIKSKVKPRDIDVPTLQDMLRKQGLNLPKR